MQYIYAMKRTSVFLEERTLQELRRAAQRQGVSAATLVREAVERYLDAPRGAVGLPSVAGKFASSRADTAESVDTLLWRNPHE